MKRFDQNDRVRKIDFIYMVAVHVLTWHLITDVLPAYLDIIRFILEHMI